MVEIVAVAIPNDRIVVVLNTFPLAFPFAGPPSTVVAQESRMNRISQGDITAVEEEVLAYKGRVVVRQLRNNGQMTFDDTVATASGGVVRVSEVSLIPDSIRINAANNKRQLVLA